MRLYTFKISLQKCALAISLLLLCSVNSYSKVVQIKYQKLILNATFTHDANDIKDSSVFLVLHGTLGHGNMEIIASLQEILQEEGEKVLAITLSLGLSNRQGMYDCNLPHDHQHEDAQVELTTWVDWLIKHEVKEVILVGHSRGAMQVAEYVANTNKKQIKKLALLAPPVLSKYPLSAEIRPKAANLETTAASKNHFKTDRFLHCQESIVSSTSLHSYYGDPLLGSNIFDVLDQISIPTIVFLGSADPVIDLTMWHKQVDFKENITVHTIEGAGHFFRDLYLYDVVDRLLAWSR